MGIALLSSACSGGDDDTKAAPSPSAVATPASATPTVAAHPAATDAYDLQAYCYKGGPATLLTGQPAYQGKGPHPVLIATTSPTPLRATQAPLPSPGETATAPAPDTYHPDPAKAQLVACVSNAGKGKLVTTCRYNHDYVRYFRQGRYDVTVYEAKTGRRLGTTKVMGDDQYECLPQVTFFDGEPQSKTEWLSASLPAFRKALAPWVNAAKS
ncbi:hypothetical protein BIV24_11995 [Streptomyces colonosanans]|uniref:Uncharacterized protein n=1 Tax=Streptomyces colonosanans TaxID=1428652 RepID=A0A1S2PIN5_9ACTN|nr:hypothetical protein BIV24_11995 [Streptomyces colonosanans]